MAKTSRCILELRDADRAAWQMSDDLQLAAHSGNEPSVERADLHVVLSFQPR